MEQEKPVKEFRLGESEVVAEVGWYAAKDGRSWLTTRTGRYYTVDGERRFSMYLRTEEIPVSCILLGEAFKWLKENPQPGRSNREE